MDATRAALGAAGALCASAWASHASDAAVANVDAAWEAANDAAAPWLQTASKWVARAVSGLAVSACTLPVSSGVRGSCMRRRRRWCNEHDVTWAAEVVWEAGPHLWARWFGGLDVAYGHAPLVALRAVRQREWGGGRCVIPAARRRARMWSPRWQMCGPR